MRRLILVLVFLVIVLGGTTYYFYKNSGFTKKQQASQQAEAKILTEQVGKLIFLPENETPTIATVTDLESLKGQSFFVDAKIGDKVLIFNDAKKAILYDPVANKIITVAPINTTAGGNTASTEPTLQINPKTEVAP